MCFMIRGYVVTPDTLLGQRLGWHTKLELADLRAVVVDSQAMRGSIRTFGNGGLFSISGAFWNQRLGAYRAFATDPAHAVLLKFTDRVGVITPEEPQALVAKLTEPRALPKAGLHRSSSCPERRCAPSRQLRQVVRPLQEINKGGEDYT
jgi:hypothetical protein